MTTPTICATGWTWTAADCWTWLLIQPIVGGLLIPLLILLLGGVIKWILGGGPTPRRDYFLLGIELALASLTLAFSRIFEWIRQDLLGVETDHLALLLYVLLSLSSLGALLLVMALMRAYVDSYAARLAAGEPAISWRRLLVMNLAGGSPLGIALLFLIE